MINPILETCIECEGDGIIYDDQGTSEKCEGCNGTGKVERLACTVFEFNGKYSNYLEKGHYGCDIDIIPIIEYLDQEFQEFVKIPEFKYIQIKSKFNSFRFYCTGLSRAKTDEVENNLKRIYDEYTNKPVLPINSNIHGK